MLKTYLIEGVKTLKDLRKCCRSIGVLMQIAALKSSRVPLPGAKDNTLNLDRLPSNPPASKVSRELANFIKKNPCILCLRFVCLSVCVELWPQISQDWPNRMVWNFLGDIYAKYAWSKLYAEKNYYPNLTKIPEDAPVLNVIKLLVVLQAFTKSSQTNG